MATMRDKKHSWQPCVMKNIHGNHELFWLVAGMATMGETEELSWQP